MAHPRSLRASSQWTQRKEMEMIENRHNKADCSGVCHCQITTYDKESEISRGALSGAETSGISTFSYQTPVQYR